MKIQCDVCEKEEAFVFCSADEAALCHACDYTIHHANKLAAKHSRFFLHYPNSKHSPLCDICQIPNTHSFKERHAYVFCGEDRAIFCTECDLTIHGGNENSKKHNKFLLTGVKVGASSSEGRSVGCNRNMASDKDSDSRSKISEYFIETIPDYCMEDLLDVSFAP